MEIGKNYQAGYIYLNEDYFNKPKELFDFIGNKIMEDFGNKDITLFDCCCARGEFLYNISKKYNNIIKLKGLDFDKALIESGQKYKGIQEKNIELIEGDAQNYNFKDELFDVITIIGGIAVFDNLNPIFINASKHLKKGGKLYVLSKINPYGMNVRIQHKNHVTGKDWQSSNYHSREYLLEVSKNSGLSFIEELDFNYSREDARREDPLRAWTVKLDDKKMFLNGIGTIYDLTLCIYEKI